MREIERARSRKKERDTHTHTHTQRKGEGGYGDCGSDFVVYKRGRDRERES